LFARVADRARVPVVAWRSVVIEEASSRSVAGIIGARVVVVAQHRVAVALPLLAMIAHGAGVAVLAFAAVEIGVTAPRFSIAHVRGALVGIVAQVEIVAAGLERLVRVAVAVVVHSVARFLGRDRSIALCEPAVGAHPFALARSPGVLHLACGPQPRLDCMCAARTDTQVGDALRNRHTADGLGLAAREPPRAVTVRFAAAAAKAPLGTVTKADVVRPLGRAVRISVARLAQVGVFRQAYEDRVRTGGAQEPARPPGRTFLLAG